MVKEKKYLDDFESLFQTKHKILNHLVIKYHVIYLILLEFLGNSSYLLNAVLVRGKIRLEGFVLLLQRLDFVKLALTEVL